MFIFASGVWVEAYHLEQKDARYVLVPVPSPAASANSLLDLRAAAFD